MSRFFKMLIRDPAAFQRSLDRLFAWDFERVIVGHGAIIERGGKAELRKALAARGVYRG